ncbi:MAG: hypothetical protein ACK4TA_13190 [Saprospiraceae bacterium]
MKARTKGLVILIILTCVLIYLRFQPYIDYPSTTFFNIHGDGFKNYATVIYHVKYDSTYLHYQGMNYPYGEHVLFTDCQPILANTIRFISHNIVDISNATSAIINLSMLFSLLLCSIFLYLILSKLELPIWYSVVMAIGITFLSPQVERMGGHYALAHAFIVPALLYLLFLFEEKRRWLWSIIITFLILIAAQLHFYYFGLAAVLITAYFFFSVWRDFSWQKVRTLAPHYALQVIFPFILLQFWVRWGDTVTDRPAVPEGFIGYRALWEGIFLNARLPVGAWIDSNIIDIRNASMENSAFIGTVAAVIFITLLVRWIRNKFKQPFLPFSENIYLQTLSPTVIAILLFALGLPFIIPGLGWLLDYTGPFRQFRGLGRFSWIFYYGWNILAAYILYHYFNKKPLTLFTAFLFLISIEIVLKEAYQTCKLAPAGYYREDILSKHKFEKSADYWFKDIDLSRYQAVLPIPFYLVGSENFGFEYGGNLLRMTLLPGLHYGLPSMGSYLSRTSFSQTIHKAPIALEPYRKTDFPKTLPSQKPLLMIIERGESAKTPQLGYLMAQGKTLYGNDQIEIREFPVEGFDKAHERWMEDLRNGWHWATEGKLYAQKNNVWLSDSTKHYILLDFDDKKSSKLYRGTGALEAPVKRAVPFWEGKLPAKNNVCNVWVYMGEDQYPRLNLKGWEINKNGKEWLIAHNAARFDLKCLDNNGWGLMEFEINMDNPDNRVRLELECKEIKHPTVFIDELLIRAKGLDMYWLKDDMKAYNNRYFQ